MKIIFNWVFFIFLLTLLADRNGPQSAHAYSLNPAKKSSSTFRCVVSESSRSQLEAPSMKCYNFQGRDVKSFRNIQESEISANADAKDSKSAYIEIYGLKFGKNQFTVIILVSANVLMLMLILWYKRRSDLKIDIILEEQKARFYRDLLTTNQMVMHEYRLLHTLNTELTERTGVDKLPMVKYIVDDTNMFIPRRTTSAVKQKAPEKKSLAPRRANLIESKIVNTIKLSLQKTTSFANISEGDRNYFEAIDKLHSLRERPPPRADSCQKQFYSANKDVLAAVPIESFRDRAMGVLLGSMVADACASYFGRLNQTPTSSKVEHCLKMSGGGAHNLTVGQIRHCELQMCLLWGIVDRNMNFDKEKVLDLNRTKEFYSAWMKSEPPSPFEFSPTLTRAFELMQEDKVPLTEILKDSKSKNRRSTSSESLLRLLPLAIWTSTVKNPYQVKKAISAEASFVHQSKLVHSAIFIYFMALQCLLQNPKDDKRGAKAYDYAYELSKQELAKGINQGDSVKEWLEEAQKLSTSSSTEEQTLMQNFNCIERPDDIKHPFILSFFLLLKSRSNRDIDKRYMKCLRIVIMLGGDVGMNAAIVMGMIGAFVGVKQIPSDMVDKVLGFDCANDDSRVVATPRDPFLSVMRHGLVNLETVISYRPMHELLIQQE